MSAPSLHEIAAMPFPASMIAMRTHYNKDWHKPEPEPGATKEWRVTIEYSVRTNDEKTYTVIAETAEQAEKLAEELFDKDPTVDDGDDLDVNDVYAEEVE